MLPLLPANDGSVSMQARLADRTRAASAMVNVSGSIDSDPPGVPVRTCQLRQVALSRRLSTSTVEKSLVAYA